MSEETENPAGQCQHRFLLTDITRIGSKQLVHCSDLATDGAISVNTLGLYNNLAKLLLGSLGLTIKNTNRDGETVQSNQEFQLKLP